ncbi:hypothetical protein F2Q69_00014024 [Brassica cretica]|uniref:Uncharacterized protein n=1 Tax=Brassica cretica TaxID=69181 RepID=A0A8S9R8L1_BRACR|nr:hypothetical protein F2Q69_00014024 [Brassica cretica]
MKDFSKERSEEYKYLWTRVSGKIGTKKRQVKTREPDRSHLSDSAPRSPRPWARTTIIKITSPMGEDNQHHGHLAHGRGRPAPWSPRPWARTTSTAVISPTGKHDPRPVHLPLRRGQSNPGQSDSFRLSCPPYSCDIRLLDHIPLVSSRSELLLKFYD